MLGLLLYFTTKKHSGCELYFYLPVLSARRNLLRGKSYYFYVVGKIAVIGF